jgi:ankyrin repeat protein
MSYDGDLMLRKAIDRCDMQMIRTILDSGVDPNLQDDLGQNALMYALLRYCNIQQKKAMVELLLEKGADVGMVNKAGEGVLFFAPNMEIIQLLINRGADPTIEDNNGSTALLSQISSFNHPDIQTLMDKVRLFLTLGLNPNIKDVKFADMTPLIYATIFEIERTVRDLLDYGADPNIADEDGHTALMYAISRGNENIALLLLERGADQTVEDNKGNSFVKYLERSPGQFPRLRAFREQYLRQIRDTLLQNQRMPSDIASEITNFLFKGKKGKKSVGKKKSKGKNKKSVGKKKSKKKSGSKKNKKSIRRVRK